jgi:hypothetical protein
VGLQIQFRMFTPQSCRGFELRRRARSRPARSDGLERRPPHAMCRSALWIGRNRIARSCSASGTLRSIMLATSRRLRFNAS